MEPSGVTASEPPRIWVRETSAMLPSSTTATGPSSSWSTATTLLPINANES